MLLKLQQIIVKPGQQTLFKDISWQQLENILSEMGEKRAARISYSHGWLEIMVPLTEHQKDKENIGDLVKILLDKLQIWEHPKCAKRGGEDKNIREYLSRITRDYTSTPEFERINDVQKT